MGSPAARLSDPVLHDAPHCHAAIHPPAPIPTPLPHAPVPLSFTIGSPSVNINGSPAVRVLDMTAPCMPAGCVPSSGGTIVRGSTGVLINGRPAARLGDVVSFPGCVGPIPCPTGRIITGSKDVNIG